VTKFLLSTYDSSNNGFLNLLWKYRKKNGSILAEIHKGLTATLACNTLCEATSFLSPLATMNPFKRTTKVYVWGQCMTEI
jgi:hypothetical protein